MSAGKNKGETLIESIVGILVATITIVFLVTIQSASYKSRNTDKDILEASYNLEAVAKLILCNLAYDDIKKNFNNRTKYVSGEALNADFIMESNILNFVQDSEGSYPNIKIGVREGEGGTLVINIKYTFENGSCISNVFYKGKYEKVKS